MNFEYNENIYRDLKYNYYFWEIFEIILTKFIHIIIL